MTLRAATRASTLAMWQTDHVIAALSSAGGPPARPEAVSTVGDRRLDVPIHTMGGKGVFVKEVQNAVLDGRADLAVHSAKDLPARTPDGLVIAAVPQRADARDALVGCAFDRLEPGARVATGSVRRRSQLAWHRPDLTFHELRGNIETRLEKAAAYDAIVIAAAALDRLQLEPPTVDVLEPSLVVPQVGQGALAVECRADDTALRDALALIEHAESRRVVDAERAFLDELGGDCDLPAGAHAVLDGDEVSIDAMVASLDGRVLVRASRRGADGPAAARELARHLLDDAGGAALIADAR